MELTDNHTAKILSIFHTSESQANVNCEIVEGKIIYKPDTNLISRHEHVTNYVYVYNGNQSLDVREFIYVVDLSKIDETSLEVKEVYDQSYADLLADFEQALNDYKDSLPQADSVRADIDEVLNKFSEDSQAKLSQYDTDVQQVITDINEAETSRVEAEVDRTSSESNRVEAEKQRVLKEASRVEAEGQRDLAESSRATAESSRVSTEEQRKTDHANRSAEFDSKADKVVLENIIENGDFSNGTTGGWMTAHGYMNRFEVVDNIAVNIETDAVNHRSFIYNHTSAPSRGNILYSNFRFKQSNITKAVMSIMYGLSGIDLARTYDNIGNDFEVYSAIGVQGDSPRFRLMIGNIEADGNPEIYLDYLMMIDLTETFGAGNEPTKEEMDRLIEITGYIDGEYVLNNKEMLGYLMSGIGEKANKKQEDWIRPTLLNGWVDRVPSNPVRFRKNEFGKVEIEGAIKGGTLGVPAFVLPSGYGSGAYYPRTFGALNYEGLMAEVTVNKNNFAISKSSTTVWISLEGISYTPN